MKPQIILLGSSTVRGCLADLDSREKPKCLTNDDDCKSCYENHCNRRIRFPQCYDTFSFQNHTNLEINASPKTCTIYEDVCFVQVNKETVIRGCVIDYAAKNDLSSDFLVESGASNRTYRECSTALCNDDKIEPVFCLKCDYRTDKNCRDPLRMTDPSNFRTKCPLELTKSGCYHFIKGELFTERGCLSELEEGQHMKCISDDDDCKMCHGDECNDKKEFLRCIEDEPSDSTRSEKLCKRYNDECFIHASNEEVRRGCLSHFEANTNITTECGNSDLDICEKCSESLCNSREIEHEHCIVCSSIEGSRSCIDDPSDDMQQQCPLMVKKLGCFLKLDGNIITRGCVGQLNWEDRIECNDLDVSCKTCIGDGCNKNLKFQQCIECSSTDVDGESCASINSTLKARQCPNDDDHCYTYIQNEIVRRNCTGDDFIKSVDDCDSNPEHCVSCTGWMCNQKDVKPEICFSCDSNTDSNCKRLENKQAEECPLSVHEHGCYHLIEEKTDVHHLRGIYFNSFSLDF